MKHTTQQQVQQITNHVRSQSDSRAVQMATVTKYQAMVLDNDDSLAVLRAVKEQISKG